METMDEYPWAVTEFGTTELGDIRRTVRLVELATALGTQPSASLPDALDDPAALKAAYRFFDTAAIRPEDMLQGHVEATLHRMQAVPCVLAVNDTTYLDWTDHPETTDLGPLTTAQQQGLLLHSTLAITPDRVPLGLLQQQIWARDRATFAQKPDHHERPITEKESQKWLLSLEAACAARAACPDTHIISVGDREADVYDLFLMARPDGVDLLVRAAQDRRTDQPERVLWASMAPVPVAATVTVQIGARAGQAARMATLAVRWNALTLHPPTKRAAEQLPSVTVWVVWAVETDPPPGVKPVEWMLLTTVPVITTDDALERVAWYACRWGIEVWHKVLKSGCRIEEKQLATGMRLQRCLTLYSVIAWRILYATMLARVAGDMPCTVLLDADEWQGLWCRIHHTTILPTQPPTLREAVRWIAQLGGFQGRRHDGEPGVTVLWKGFLHLVDIAAMYRLFHPHGTARPRVPL